MRRAPVQGARDFVGDAVGNEDAAGAAKQLQRDVVAYCEGDDQDRARAYAATYGAARSSPRVIWNMTSPARLQRPAQFTARFPATPTSINSKC